MYLFTWIFILSYGTKYIIHTYNYHQKKTIESTGLLKTDTCSKFQHVSHFFLYFFITLTETY